MTRLGIIGGGQLARMLALAARPLGIDCIAVDPTGGEPAQPVAEVITAAYDDPAAIERLAKECDVVTVELEAVPAHALQALAAIVPVHPGPAAVRIAQDRLSEKRFFRSIGVPTAPFDAEATLPAIVKTRRGGYDGRGQQRVSDAVELADALATLPEPITESVVAFDRELAVLAARDRSGFVRVWPVVETAHRDGILRRAVAPAPHLPGALQREAEDLVETVLTSLEYVGVIAVELFLVGDRLLANELAPRVHNSGHWTIEGSTTSQFEQHVRAVCGLPLGMADVHGCAATVNCIGSLPPAPAVLAVPGAHLHTYGKAPRAARKVGHVNVTAADPSTLQQRLAAVEAIVAECEDAAAAT